MPEKNRRFVRVRDVVRLSYELISESAVEEEWQKIQFLRNQDADRYPFRPRPISPFREGDVDPAYRSLAEAIHRLDQKMDYLIFIIDKLTEGPQSKGYSDPVRCNISGSGMLFGCDEEIPEGSFLHLSVLLGTYSVTKPIHLIAKVIRIAPTDEVYGPKPYRVGVDFVHIARDDRETVISHIFEVQRAEIRAKQE